MFSVPLTFIVIGEDSSFVMRALDFISSRETQGTTVAVTAAVSLTCAHTLCDIAPSIIMTTLTMLMTVLIQRKNARTMPTIYFISLSNPPFNHIYYKDLRQKENLRLLLFSLLICNFANITSYSFVRSFLRIAYTSSLFEKTPIRTANFNFPLTMIFSTIVLISKSCLNFFASMRARCFVSQVEI